MLLRGRACFLRRTMALFTQVLNPLTGQNEWDTKGDDYDYHQEIACAGFGDMLHDTERNEKYFAALKKTIEQMHAEGRKAHVLDIGTGTGILSMMALEAGADTVTACEAFEPMAECAERILRANRMGDHIRLVKKRSTDLQVGEGGDMPSRANLLVTEVLDTELIGEGAIGIYNHAHAELLTDDALCIPARATCYAQVVQSPLAAQWNSMKLLVNLEGDVLLQPPKEVTSCRGEAALHDVQLSQLPLDQFHPLTDPLEIFEFDFSSKTSRETERSMRIVTRVKKPGSTDLVFYWWDIKMDAAGEIQLSCAPFWAHPDTERLANEQPERPRPNVIPWRDHWMQAIYYIPKPLHLHTPDAEFVLSCQHDEYSLWFDALPATEGASKKAIPRYTCTCSLHMTYARNRIGQMNQSTRNKRYMRYLEDAIHKDAHVLCLGDGTLLGLATAKMGAASVVCHEPHRYSRRFMEAVVQHNQLQSVQFVEKLDQLEDGILSRFTNIFAEPYFLTSILPWDNFYFGTLLLQIKDRLSANVKITPFAARVYAVPVEFLDLHKIRTPVENCEGFDVRLFDKMVSKSTALTQSKVEAQPLWEYPCRALASPQLVLQVNFNDFAADQEQSGKMRIESAGTCNGIALWVDWQIDENESDKTIVSTGPTEPIVPGQYIKWDMFVRQGVHLIGKAKQVKVDDEAVNWSAEFKPTAGKINFHFKLKTNTPVTENFSV